METFHFKKFCISLISRTFTKEDIFHIDLLSLGFTGLTQVWRWPKMRFVSQMLKYKLFIY